MAEPATFSNFVEENSNFLLSTFGMVGLCLSGLFLFILKSRCKTFKCGCIECQRDVIPVEDLNDITLTNTRNIPEV